jgi:protease I
MRLKGKTIGVFIEDGFEDLEFWVTVMRLREEGAEVRILGAAEGKPHRGKNGLEARASHPWKSARADDFAGLVVPGGWAPDKLRRYPEVIGLVKDVHAKKGTLGFICHAGLVAISAKLVKGPCTGSLGIKDDLVNAGGTWKDEPAFRDGQLVWGRVVEDIPAFCRELVTALAAG